MTVLHMGRLLKPYDTSSKHNVSLGQEHVKYYTLRCSILYFPTVRHMGHTEGTGLLGIIFMIGAILLSHVRVMTVLLI